MTDEIDPQPAGTSVRAAPRGRPADAAKHAAILAAAAAQFINEGFAATTMERIADAANVSKLTLYRHFGSKDALFAEAVAQKCQTMLDGLRDAAIGHPRAQEALEAIGRMFLALLLPPEALALQLVIVSERNRSPELGRLFYANAILPTQGDVAAQVERLVARGDLAGDPTMIANDFLGLLRSRPMMHLELGVDVLDPDALETHIRHVTGVMLRAYAPRWTPDMA
jgi:TetR/AcrR family transcriptional regulator, mexJK operon transcriptional repressor